MANLSTQRDMKVLSAFAGAGVVVICGMIVSTFAEALVRRDNAVIDLIPVVAVIGGLFALIPLAISVFLYLIAKAFHLVNALSAMLTGLALGAVCGWLTGNPPLRVWSGSLIGLAAALVWWKLYSRLPSALTPSNTR